ncbi:SPOR domain-containing protein [Castellaniella caeni]|uniref:SPOR domain-containing protein n=1 Tax=Castellaniella caeni TaxID=266123 RepID=UPI00082F55BD|nr:SPOR domain-containing protein [Castellaniella caeni]
MFSRHETDTGKRAGSRSGQTSEAQLRELRGKARRRLIGALALVLAAFIVVPWLFEKPVSEDTRAPIVVPAAPTGLPPVTDAAPSAQADGAVQSPEPATSPQGGSGGTLADGQAASGSLTPPTPDGAGGTVQPPAAATAPAVTPPPVASVQPPKPAARPETAARPAAEPSKPAKPAARAPAERTDDGSVALALLAGKAPPASSPAPAAGTAQGRYFLQVAAYTTEQDAQRRRDNLRQSGVTDAYVERGQSAGRTVYRLRVGPFSSHEAAQAAQTRLRALGYQNGLISDK